MRPSGKGRMRLGASPGAGGALIGFAQREAHQERVTLPALEHFGCGRRAEILQDANFYGAMDGSSKFIKGDAVAGIIITLINALQRTSGKRGVAALCIGGGEATAVAIQLI